MLSPAARHVSSVNPVNQLPVICDNKSFSFWVWEWLRNLQEKTEILIRQECFWGLSQFLNGSCIWHYNFTPPAVRPVGCTTDNFVWERKSSFSKKTKEKSLYCNVFKIRPSQNGSNKVCQRLKWLPGRKASGWNEDSFIEVHCFKNPIGFTEGRWKWNQSSLQHMQTLSSLGREQSVAEKHK